MARRKKFMATEGNSVVDRRGRATEQRLFALETDIVRRLEGFERAMSNLAELDQNNGACAQELEGRIMSLERSVSRLRQLIQQSTQAQTEASSSIAGASSHSNRLALDLRAEEIARDLKHHR